jgi:sarcosine dehydrogenase
VTLEDGADAFVLEGRYEIEVAQDRVPARASLKAFYDPAASRVKG